MKVDLNPQCSSEGFDHIAVDIRQHPASECNFILTILLCFFLGVFGAHRFYAGKIGTGFLMLLTFGGLGIWSFVDLLLIVCGHFYDKKDLLVRARTDDENNTQPLSQCNFILTIILCFFFGIFGVHRFYTGKIGTGILMLFTLGGLLVWEMIDFIIIISGCFRDKKGLIIKPISAINYKL